MKARRNGAGRLGMDVRCGGGHVFPPFQTVLYFSWVADVSPALVTDGHMGHVRLTEFSAVRKMVLLKCVSGREDFDFTASDQSPLRPSRRPNPPRGEMR